MALMGRDPVDAGMTSVSLALEASQDMAFYLAKRRTLVIYHATGDRIVALIEIVSPGNQHSQRTLAAFLDKAMAALNEGYHLLVIDLFPPARYDPNGMHGLIWEYLNAAGWQVPADRQLSLASYCAKSPTRLPRTACHGGCLGYTRTYGGYAGVTTPKKRV